MNQNISFSGLATIYLEGKRALQPYACDSDKVIQYYLGSKESKICIIDYRRKVNNKSQSEIHNPGQMEFADLFSSPAWITVKAKGEKVEITLGDCLQESLIENILWMGVVDGNSLAANPVSWLIFEETGDNRIAFVGLIEEVALHY